MKVILDECVTSNTRLILVKFIHGIGAFLVDKSKDFKIEELVKNVNAHKEPALSHIVEAVNKYECIYVKSSSCNRIITYLDRNDSIFMFNIVHSGKYKLLDNSKDLCNILKFYLRSLD